MWLASAVATMAMLGACGADSEQASTDGSTAAPATTEPVIILSAEEVGPAAFTPPVDTAPLNDAPTGACDGQALINELAARPDARREWAAVLSIPEDQVDAYIDTLEPGILGADTRMTNHGLRDGQAFAIQSTLTAGTAVLIDTSDGSPTPVTRCRCGNPLLPPVYPPAATTTTYDDGTTTTTYYDTTTTTYYYDTTTTEYYDTTTTEYYPTASEPPYTEPEPEDYEPIP